MNDYLTVFIKMNINAEYFGVCAAYQTKLHLQLWQAIAGLSIMII